MGAQPLLSSCTPDEYLAHERESALKHEYIAGEIVAMSGASYAHNVIVFNLPVILAPQLRSGKCGALVNDMRVAIPSRQLYTYPDLVAWCGEPEFGDEVFDTLLNPVLLIEVLSPSTEVYDRSKKFEDYRSIPTLQEYVLIAQDRPHIDRFYRGDDGDWRLVDATGLEDQVELTSIDCVLALSEVYDKVEFPEPDVEAEERGGLFRE